MNTKLIGYWVITTVLALELLVGGVWDLDHNPYVVNVVSHLGYPIFLLSILGFWKVLASAALLVPRLQVLKEWAYAGVFFEMTGAAASHIAVGDGAAIWIVPVIFAAITLGSRALGPPTRRLTPAAV